MGKLRASHSLASSRRSTNPLIAGRERDLSGRDFHNRSILGQNFFEFIFNGCSFERIRATQSIFQHAEFTETYFSECKFEDTSFDHSDLVLADVASSEFLRCSFQNAEWRDTQFENVQFRQCIFRNTTTSLTRFINCQFDEASAANFVGPSKRFSVFSGTVFPFREEQLSFLQTNFGISASRDKPLLLATPEDPLFELSRSRYSGRLTSAYLLQLILRALAEVTATRSWSPRLRMRYLAAICKVCLEEQLLSVFALQLLEKELSNKATLIHHRDQALELLGLLLTVRAFLRDAIIVIEKEVESVPQTVVRRLELFFEFDNKYERHSVENYLEQLGAYCHVSSEDIAIKSLRTGSTFADVVIAGSAYVADIFRFIRYSLSLATVTINQAGKLRTEYNRITGGAPKRKKSAKSRRTRVSAVGVGGPRQEPSVESVTKEVVGLKLANSRPIEVFVDTMNERVLVVDGRVKVTISLVSQ